MKTKNTFTYQSENKIIDKVTLDLTYAIHDDIDMVDELCYKTIPEIINYSHSEDQTTPVVLPNTVFIKLYNIDCPVHQHRVVTDAMNMFFVMMNHHYETDDLWEIIVTSNVDEDVIGLLKSFDLIQDLPDSIRNTRYCLHPALFDRE